MELCGVATGVGVASFFHISLRIYKKRCFDTAVKIEKNSTKYFKIYLNKLMRCSIFCRY